MLCVSCLVLSLPHRSCTFHILHNAVHRDCHCKSGACKHSTVYLLLLCHPPVFASHHILPLASRSIGLTLLPSADSSSPRLHRRPQVTMLFSTVFVASAFAAFANAQTIETSSASSVAPSSTVSQSMPPVATQGFNIGNVSTTLLCELTQVLSLKKS